MRAWPGAPPASAAASGAVDARAGAPEAAGPGAEPDERPGAPPPAVAGRALLISTYDLGHAPFGLASPAAWLRDEGFDVTLNDMALDPLDEAAAARADLIAIHVPMHTAARLATRLVPRLRTLNPRAHLAVYGLYAALGRDHLAALGVDSVVSGEFEASLAQLARRIAGSEAPRGIAIGREVVLDRLEFRVPDRTGLPAPGRYARLRLPDGRTRVAGYTEASRGCRHTCRHCPIVPVYGGRFRIVPRAVVLEDIRRQVRAGARHITFGDPDFLNGPGHALPLVRALHAEHPELSYDVTIKIEHLIRHAAVLPELAATGCLLVTSAVEAVDDRILERLDKRHTREDFPRAAGLCRDAGIALHPTFVAFTPWTTPRGWLAMLDTIAGLGLIENVAPVQLALRLLIPAGSRLLELEEVRSIAGPFDPEALVHPWRHPNPGVDDLHAQAFAMVRAASAAGEPRAATFEALWSLAERSAGRAASRVRAAASWQSAPVPYLTEPWYC